MSLMGSVSRWITFLLLGLAAAGCASVQVSMPGIGGKSSLVEAGYTERVALNDAADALADHPWGETPDSGMVSVLFGTVSDNAQERSVKSYISSIETRGDDPVTGVFTDADMSLAHARRVVEAGRQAIDATSPVPSDIATLERAIGDARECRTIYVAALETLERRKRDVSRKDILVIRDAFTQTINDMGSTADLVADRVASAQQRDRFANRSVLGTGNAGGE